MMNVSILKGWMEFVASGEADSHVQDLIDELDSLRVRRILIQVLSWLRTNSKLKRSLVPLAFDPKYSWIPDLNTVMRVSGSMGGLLSLLPDRLVIHPDLSPEETKELLTLVDRGYNPPVFATWK